jgi:hypothetical protein
MTLIENTQTGQVGEIEYRGYTIRPRPVTDNGELWFGGYEIRKNGEVVRERSNIFPGFFHFGAACSDSIEHAKIEIENLHT